MANPIKSGVTSDGIVLTSDDITIESGGTVTRVTANNGGRVFLFGYSDSATLNNGGQMSIYSGGTAEHTTVNSGVYMYAGNGGLARQTRIAGGNLYLLEFGLASDTTIGSGGAMNVLSGASAAGVTVEKGGAAVFYEGGKAALVVENGGAVYVSAGAEVIFASHTIDGLSLRTGSATLHSGTTAWNASITGEGNLHVFAGGLFLSGTVGNCTGGGISISSGGVASALTVSAGGVVYVMDGASVAGLTVQAGGSLSILTGATVTGLLDNGGNVYIQDGTSVSYAANIIADMVLSSGYYTVRSGTTLTNPVVTKDGNLSVNEGGLFLSGSVGGCTSAGGLCINFGGVASAATIAPGGVLYVVSGGSAVACDLSGGTLSMNPGAIVNGLNVTGGSLTVDADAILSDAVIRGGTVYYLTGSTVGGTTLSTAGNLTVCSGAVARGLTVNSGGTLTIQSGAEVTDLKDNGGQVYIQDGATVSFAANVIDGFTLSSGYYYVRSGTILSNALVGGEGMLVVSSGGIVDGTTVNSCSAETYKGLYVSSGGTALHTNVSSGGALYVYGLGAAVGGVVDSGGFCQVMADASAGEIEVRSGGSFIILSGAKVTALKDVGGYVYIQDGATVTYASNVIADLVVSDAAQSVRSGTTLTRAVVRDSGIINVYEGGSLESSTIGTGGVVYVLSGGSAVACGVTNGTLRLLNGGRASGTTLYSGTINVDADAVMTDPYVKGGTVFVLAQGRADATVLGGSAKFTVCAGASASGLTVQPGGSLTIQSGAKVTALKDSGGYVYIEDGADVTFAPNVIESLVVSSGTYFVRSGTTLTWAVVAGNGVINVYEGGVVESAIVNSCNVSAYKGLYVSSGGTALQTTVNSGGAFYVYEGGFASGGVVSSGAACQVRAGGVVSDLTVRSGGFMTVSSGGTGYDVLEDGGTVNVLDGASVTFVERVVSGTTITNGTTTIHPGTVLVGATVAGDGKLNVVAGGCVESTTVNACGADGGLVIYSGGTAVGNTMNSNGFAYIFSGGTAIDNTIGPGGSMTIFSGAVMKNVEVLARPDNDLTLPGGKLYLSSGAVLTGRIRVASAGAYIFIDDVGATIDFDISEIDPSGDQEVLLDDYERIRPEPKEALDHVANFTLTVSGDQSIGTYKITRGKASADLTFPALTVRNTGGEVLGRLVKDKDSFVYNGVQYYLDMGVEIVGKVGILTLFLHIGDGATADSAPVPTVSADVKELTNSCVTVTAAFDSSLSTRQYSLDGTNWLTYQNGVTMTENGRVYFRGLNRSGASGIASYTVRNIDNTAPTAPAGLVANVSGRTVTMNWRPAADDLAGVREYIVTCVSDDGRAFTSKTTDTRFVLEDADYAAWRWSVQAVDCVGNLSEVSAGEAFEVVNHDVPVPPAPAFLAKSDVDGSGISDVMFQYTGGDFQLGFWMNGTNAWRGNGLPHPAEWEVLGTYDMDTNGRADAVLVGNVVVNGVKGAYIGYYLDSDDSDANWTNIGYLNNAADVAWKNKVGNLTGNDGANSIVWYAPKLYALGAWTDGTDRWVTLSNDFGGDAWTLIGCGDFDGDGKDSVVMAYNGGELYYAVNLDGSATELAKSDSGWEVRAIGDFSGDGRDDIVAFHAETGIVAMWGDGLASNWSMLGQLDAKDWFVVGAGDYDGDAQDDLLVRQYSTGMLGYYSGGDMARWNTLGYGVDMSWTVIA